MPITMQPVKSTQIESAGYDPATKKLAVKFQRGAMYEYSDVSPETYTQFMAAESAGKFFGTHIKGKFEFERMPEGSA